MKDFIKHIAYALLCSFVFLPICISAQEEEESDAIPDDILELMKSIDGFHPERDFYETSTISGWFKEDGKEYGLINAQVVNFEWDDYSGHQTQTLYRSFEDEHQYSNYKDWLSNMDKRKKLVTVRTSSSNDAILNISSDLNFPVQFSYKLEFEDNVIATASNPKSTGRELLSSELVETPGVYQLSYTIDGYSGRTTFIVK
ncbi:MAG: hypothetical protein LBO69_04330 [Ignavibacteria bacterium]|jgi:hypothetical protein|nr:hypothetical protein [Ignavibacteria bacterium]